MVSTRAGKRAVAEALHPLNHSGILDEVLDFVGSGQFASSPLCLKAFELLR
jgi:hypothetical protein